MVTEKERHLSMQWLIFMLLVLGLMGTVYSHYVTMNMKEVFMEHWICDESVGSCTLTDIRDTEYLRRVFIGYSLLKLLLVVRIGWSLWKVIRNNLYNGSGKSVA